MNEQKIHKLKTWPVYFELALNGSKPFEYRKDDRDYRVGDLLVLCEYVPSDELFTGRQAVKVITYVMRNSQNLPFPLTKDWCILGVANI